MKIAVIGCSHGELDRIYDDINEIEKNDKIFIDLVIICGDFQSIRNEYDMQCIAVPHKYRNLGTFHKYYSGERIAPKVTLFVGGNHEASNHLQTLAFGGWVAKNIYYLGYANVLRYKGLRIAGLSGIHQRSDTSFGHFERLPFDESTKRSAYHMRQSDVYKIMQLSNESQHNSDQTQQPIDIFISHDWPLNIHSCGDVNDLLRRKKHFLNDIRNNCLGNPLLEPLVRYLKPRHWFSAHLHVRFEALINHTSDCKIQTKFLALDKVLGNRKYLEIIDIEPTVPSNEDGLQYDAEWLAILKSTDKLLSIEKKCSVPALWSKLHSVTQENIDQVIHKFQNDLKIPENFEMSEPAINGLHNDNDPKRLRNFTNPQTTQFCAKLGITDPIAAIIDSMKPIPNPDQISISDDEEEEELSDENPQKRHKLDDNIDGGNVFFIDRKGDNDEKGDHFCDSVENIEKNETNITSYQIQGTDTQNDMIDITIENQNLGSKQVEPIMASTSNVSNETLTKRQLKRRADKLKKQRELKQLEKLDSIKKPNINETNKKLKKLEIKKASEARRKLILERLEWVKANLVMKSESALIDVLSIDKLSLETKPQTESSAQQSSQLIELE